MKSNIICTLKNEVWQCLFFFFSWLKNEIKFLKLANQTWNNDISTRSLKVVTSIFFFRMLNCHSFLDIVQHCERERHLMNIFRSLVRFMREITSRVLCTCSGHANLRLYSSLNLMNLNVNHIWILWWSCLIKKQYQRSR